MVNVQLVWHMELKWEVSVIAGKYDCAIVRRKLEMCVTASNYEFAFVGLNGDKVGCKTYGMFSKS